MLFQPCWPVSLLFFISTNALLISSSTTHSSISTTIKKSTVPTSSTHHTTTTTKKTSTKTSTTHSSTRSSTSPPTSTPSTFYLVAENTGQTALDGSYLNLVTAPSRPVLKDLHFAGKTPAGAATFSLTTPAGYLRCNDASGGGPLYASVAYGHPYTQTLYFDTFADPANESPNGQVAVTCQINSAPAGDLTCQWYVLQNFYFQSSSDVGQIVDLAEVGDTMEPGLHNFTIKVVPV